MDLQILVLVVGIVLLLLAGWWLAARRKHPGPTGPRWEDVAVEDLFLDVDPEAGERLLEDWRWKVGEDARVFRATVFGDLFLRAPGGQIGWLDTGWGSYAEVARSAGEWNEALRLRGHEWFHWPALRELRALGVELKEGQVYSWQQFPMLGGAEAAGNVDFVSLEVHVSHAGRLAEAIKDIPPGTRIDGFEFEALGPPDAGEGAAGEDLFDVVVNEEEQYSILPLGSGLPPGWKSAGRSGTQQECLEYIREVWTDMRPLSLREKMDGG
jgi:MbtH protein